MLSVVFIAPANAAEPVGSALLSKVIVESVSQSTKNPNDIIKVTVTLKNLNTTVLNEVMISVNGLSSDTLSLTNTFGPFTVDLEAGGSGSVSFDLYASPKIAGGNYPLSLTLTYLDINGINASVDRNISVLVDAPVTDIATPKIIVTSYDIGADKVYIGDKFKMTFTLQNTSSNVVLKNIMLSFTSELNAYTPVSGASNQLYIGDIAAGGSYTGTVNLKANSTLGSGIYVLNLGFQYQDIYNNTYASAAGISIQLVGKEAEGVATPQVVVSSYDIGADQVLGGDAFEMTLVLKNTSADTATNVLLSFASDVNAFIAAPGFPNQLYIGSIAPGESYTGKISLKANSTIESGTYSLNIGLQYQDTYSIAHASATQISLQLEQKQKLSISSIKLPDTIVMSSKALLNVGYENPGESDIKNLVMNLSGNIPANEKTVAIGTVKAGSSGNVDQFITLQKTGSQELGVSFTFEDSEGNSYSTAIRSVTLDVLAASAGVSTANPTPTTGEQTVTAPAVNINSLWVYIVIVGIVLAAAAVVLIIYYRKKKKPAAWQKSGK